jgi:hypothetical protein
MKAKPRYYLAPTRAPLLALPLVCSSLLALSPTLTAQEINFQQSIDSTSEALIALDIMASDCLSALDSSDNTATSCDEFMAAIDGELMASYLEQCRILKNWRDEYVDQTVAADLDADNENNEEMLRRLVSIEFTCGENTLRSRTQFVLSAFNRLNNAATNNGISSPGTRRQLSESRFNAIENAERQRLQDALQNQQQRSLQENERQFNALENELIRQQIQRPSLPN